MYFWFVIKKFLVELFILYFFFKQHRCLSKSIVNLKKIKFCVCGRKEVHAIDILLRRGIKLSPQIRAGPRESEVDRKAVEISAVKFR